MAAIVVAGGVFHGQVDVSQLLVDREGRPNRGVPRVFPRTVFPSFVPVLALLRDGVEDPLPLTRPDIVTTDVPGNVFHRGRARTHRKRSAHHDHVPRDDRGRRRSDDGLDEVHRPVELQPEIDDPIRSKGLDLPARVGVQRHHVIGWGDHVDAVVSLPIRPVSDTPARVRSGGAAGPLTFVHAPHPEHLTATGVQGDHVAA